MADRSDTPIKRTIRRQQLREMVPLADSTISRWSSAESFRDASLFPPVASSGTWRRSKPGWLRADQCQSLAPNLPTSGNGDRALFESRVGFKQRHRRRDEYRNALLPCNPGVDNI